MMCNLMRVQQGLEAWLCESRPIGQCDVYLTVDYSSNRWGLEVRIGYRPAAYASLTVDEEARRREEKGKRSLHRNPSLYYVISATTICSLLVPIEHVPESLVHYLSLASSSASESLNNTVSLAPYTIPQCREKFKRSSSETLIL